jgi:hypothetical protein
MSSQAISQITRDTATMPFCLPRRRAVVHQQTARPVRGYGVGMAAARLASVALDCAEPLPLAAFSANLLGGEIAAASEMVVAVRTDRGWLMALRVPDFVPPDWPGGAVPSSLTDGGSRWTLLGIRPA